MLTRQDVEEGLHYMERNGLIRLSRSTSGTWRQMYCPFHSNGQEKRPSCGCSLEPETKGGTTFSPGRFYCFACQANYSFSRGIKEILELKGTSLAAHPDLERYVNDQDNVKTDSLIPDGMMSSILASYAVDNLKMRTKQKIDYVTEKELAGYRFTVPYMYQRRLTDAVIDRYDVGFDGKFLPPGRSKPVPCVTFPVRDIQGRTLFVCRRSIESKYFYLPEGVEKPVYGIYELPKDSKEVIVCESIFNALTCVVYGHPAVALLGTGTSYQISQLKRLGAHSFVLCLDNDFSGRKGTDKLKKALSISSMVWTMTVPEDKDANDLEYREFQEIYNARQ